MSEPRIDWGHRINLFISAGDLYGAGDLARGAQAEIDRLQAERDALLNLLVEPETRFDDTGNYIPTGRWFVATCDGTFGGVFRSCEEAEAAVFEIAGIRRPS